MTVGQLIEKLKEYPLDMPVAVCGDIYSPPEYEGNKITVSQRTWYDTNYPWNRPEFEYVNLE
jgi:hypothetical protein